jgi:flagellar biosynthesis/type III secretory pathway chaperone
MSEYKKMAGVLKKLIVVLGEEKQILIQNDASALTAVIEKKNILIDKIEEFKGQSFSGDEEIRKMGSQIKELQETNMLLTKQAISFQNKFLMIIAKYKTPQYSTYSSKGDLCGNRGIKIVDQKV